MTAPKLARCRGCQTKVPLERVQRIAGIGPVCVNCHPQLAREADLMGPPGARQWLHDRLREFIEHVNAQPERRGPYSCPCGISHQAIGQLAGRLEGLVRAGSDKHLGDELLAALRERTDG